MCMYMKKDSILENKLTLLKGCNNGIILSGSILIEFNETYPGEWVENHCLGYKTSMHADFNLLREYYSNHLI